jgi:hypothetical protein
VGGDFPRPGPGVRRAVSGCVAANTRRMTTSAVRTAPAAVQMSVVLWLAAIGAGAVEALVHLLLPEPPTLTQLAARFGIYAVLTVLVLALRTGRDAVRWTVAVLLGGFGTLSLVIEPISWLMAGGSPGLFLVTADAPELVAATLRIAHLGAVFSALLLMFRPAANAWFRAR